MKRRRPAVPPGHHYGLSICSDRGHHASRAERFFDGRASAMTSEWCADCGDWLGVTAVEA